MYYLRGTNRIHTLLLRLFFRFDYIGKNVVISPSCDINRRAAQYIHLGDGVRLLKDVWLNVPHEAPAPVKNHPIIKIGSGTDIGRRSLISGIHRIDIGRNVLLAPGVFITDHNHESISTDVPIKDQGVTEGGTVIIEDGCWLGYNSVVLAQRGREIRLGRNTVVGANTVVTESSPPHGVLVGYPGRNIGHTSLGKETL